MANAMTSSNVKEKPAGGKTAPAKPASNVGGQGLTLGTEGAMGFRDDPEDPMLASKGADVFNSGKYYITIVTPASEEELDRTYCEITYEPSGGTAVILDSGDICEPLDGRFIRQGNLDAGTYIFRAEAKYDEGDAKSSLSVTVP